MTATGNNEAIDKPAYFEVMNEFFQARQI